MDLPHCTFSSLKYTYSVSHKYNATSRMASFLITGLEIRDKSGNLFTGYSETESRNLRL